MYEAAHVRLGVDASALGNDRIGHFGCSAIDRLLTGSALFKGCRMVLRGCSRTASRRETPACGPDSRGFSLQLHKRKSPGWRTVVRPRTGALTYHLRGAGEGLQG